MIFSPLNKLLLSKRSAQKIVSFASGETICWAQFLADIKTLTVQLKDVDKPRWAICCDDSYHFSVAFFAAVYAGKNIVLPGNYQSAMLLSLSEHFDAIIHDGLVADDFTKQQLILPLTEQPQSSEFQLDELDLAQIALTLFTSGSSGLPKAINKSLFMLDAEIHQLEALWGELLGNTNIVSTVSHQHIYGLLFRVLWPLCAGRAFARADLVYPEQLIASANNNCTLISSPALLKRLPENNKGAFYAAIFSSGGPLNAQSDKQCHTLFNLYPFEVFGSTETGGIGYRQQLHAGAPWTFFSGIVARLAQDDCLSLRSPWLDENSWYQSSDQCELLENNQFVLKGRVDRIVKIEEKRISLIEVEQRLNQLEWIDESVVLLLDDIHRLTLGALITLSDQGKKNMKRIGKGRFWIELRQALRLWLEPVGIPRHFRVVSEIPVNTQGKLLYNEIAALFVKPNVSKPFVNKKTEQIMSQRNATIIEQELSANKAILTLQIDPQLIYFEGHFPHYPLLPGVTQIDWAVFYGKKLLNAGSHFAGMEVIKFQEPILPKSVIQLTLTWDAQKQKLHFSYSSATGQHSSGRIKLSVNKEGVL